MNSTLLARGLFAQISNWERLGDGLHRGRGRLDLADFLPFVLALVVAAIGIWLLAKIRQRHDMSRRCDDRNKLFRELCLAHNIKRNHQKLLWQLAEVAQLSQPAEVFLRPSLFRTDQLPQELSGAASDIEALRKRLF